MYPDGYYNSPYGCYYNNTSLGGWLIIIVLLILVAFLIKRDSNIIDTETTDPDNSYNMDGIAEYWCSDTPEQTMGSTEVISNMTFVHRTPVTDKNRIEANTPNFSGTVRTILLMYHRVL